MRKPYILYCITIISFLLGIHEGRIALWKDGDPEPVKVFPYSARLLPEKDRQLLEKGLVLDSESELSRALEDYLS